MNWIIIHHVQVRVWDKYGRWPEKIEREPLKIKCLADDLPIFRKMLDNIYCQKIRLEYWEI